MQYVLLALLAVAIFATWRVLARRRARAELLETPLDAAERAIVAREVPMLARLPDNLRPRLEGRINLFREQVEFIGCNGLEVTEEMELSIAAQAALLTVGSDVWYDHLNTVLIYPGAFKSRQVEYQGYVATERETVRTGESWMRGPVILSWQHSSEGAQDADDGHNVVLHEFAHQIDDLSGATNGVPPLAKGQSFAEWERVVLEAYERHLANVDAGRRTALDPYGAEGHEEFFAVAVEAFFETPQALQRDEPELYAQLGLLFGVDPASW